MEKKSNGLLAAALIIAAFVLGWSLKMPVSALKQYDRTVTVRGLATREVKADYVIAPFAFSLLGNDLQDLYLDVQQKNAIVINYLKAAGITDAEITVASPSFEDRRSYDNNGGYVYQMTSVITVGTTKVDDIINLKMHQGTLMEQGVAMAADNWQYSATYSFKGLNEIKPAMIEEATKNAREAAQKFAADSDSKVGKIKSATQGQFSIEDRDSNTPYIKNVRVVTYVDYYLKD